MNLDALQAVSAAPNGVLFSGLFTDCCIVCFIGSGGGRPYRFSTRYAPASARSAGHLLKPDRNIQVTTQFHRCHYADSQFSCLLCSFRKGSHVPAVHYVPFIAAPAPGGELNNGLFPHLEAKIFEGHDLQELSPSYKVQLLLALQEVEEFRSAACPVGDCR
jgi:hypothetical protein